MGVLAICPAALIDDLPCVGSVIVVSWGGSSLIQQ